jgi:hypothetical protein
MVSFFSFLFSISWYRWTGDPPQRGFSQTWLHDREKSRFFLKPWLCTGDMEESVVQIWLLLLSLEISYKVIIISWRILVSFRGIFFEDYILAWWNIWVSILLLLLLLVFPLYTFTKATSTHDCRIINLFWVFHFNK